MDFLKNKLFQYVTASLAIHLVMLLIFSDVQTRTTKPQSERIEIELKDSGKKERQFVTDPNMDKLQKSLEKLEDKVRLLSKTTQRTRAEQVARQKGQTRNLNQEQKINPQIDQVTEKQAWDPPSIDGAGEVLTKTKKEITKKDSSTKQFQVHLGQSAISEYIPEVREGSFTSLNTDQFLFYTFYARINEQIRNRWVQNLSDFSNSYPPQVLDQLSRRNQITVVEVLLTRDGNYVKSFIHRKSDHPGLDQAVVRSFTQAQPFNNPPLEILSEDGLIHLHYSFHLQWRPRSMASGSR